AGRARHQLRETDRGADAERDRDRERDRRRGERAPDEGQGAEAREDRVPRGRGEEAPPEGRPGRRGPPPEHDADDGGEPEHGERERERDGVEKRVADRARAPARLRRREDAAGDGGRRAARGATGEGRPEAEPQARRAVASDRR